MRRTPKCFGYLVVLRHVEGNARRLDRLGVGVGFLICLERLGSFGAVSVAGDVSGTVLRALHHADGVAVEQRRRKLHVLPVCALHAAARNVQDLLKHVGSARVVELHVVLHDFDRAQLLHRARDRAGRKLQPKMVEKVMPVGEKAARIVRCVPNRVLVFAGARWPAVTPSSRPA